MTYKVGRCLLRHRLKDARMSQQELAMKLGVTKQQIFKYANNERRMSLQTAMNVSSILGCSIEELYEWIEVG